MSLPSTRKKTGHCVVAKLRSQFVHCHVPPAGNALRKLFWEDSSRRRAVQPWLCQKSASSTMR